LRAALAIALLLGAACSKRNLELIVTGVDLDQAGDVGGAPMFRARLLAGSTCPHEVTIGWSSDGGHVTGVSVRLERRMRTSQVVANATLDRYSPGETRGHVRTTCLDSQEGLVGDTSSIHQESLELHSDGGFFGGLGGLGGKLPCLYDDPALCRPTTVNLIGGP
jgi:hypothetical protein